MKNQIQLFKAFCFASLLLFSLIAHAQGSTTSKMSGTVFDKAGVELSGAAIIATHTPTGSKYNTITDGSGNFKILNMETGGPYKIEASYISFKNYVREDIMLRLGSNYRLNITLQDETFDLDEIVIKKVSRRINSSSGTGSNLNKTTIEQVPTIARGLTDYTRLDPRASISNSENGNATSFTGINNRYNAIFVDGAVNNDLFGLSDSGTNGGQAGISPISIDAIKEIQISVAPYDVTKGGFAGGSINAVTRTGTNNLEGSAYYLLRNESFAGKTPTSNPATERIKLPEFKAETYGFRIGGPIIKNKLFYFINTELQRNETPSTYPFADYNGNSSIATVDAIHDRLLNVYGYEAGNFRNNTAKLKGEKIIAKVNWNINDNHKISLRHSYVKGVQSGSISPNPDEIIFSNSAQIFPSTTHSSALELNSRFGNNKFNKFIIGYTNVNDDRSTTGQVFPNIRIQDGNARIEAGSEAFSHANAVKQKTLSITNDFTLSLDKHTLTLGTHNEFYDILNVFLPLHPARYQYSSPDKFFADEAYLYLYGHTVGNTQIGDDAISAAADFKASQLAFYIQDEFQVNNRLKITGGLRLDIPVFNDRNTPLINDDFNTNTIPLIEAQGYDINGAQASRLPNTQLLFSPRLGLEYQLDTENTAKLRGGAGIFTSRVPFVWPGGVYLRNGLAAGFTSDFNGDGFGPVGAGGIPFNPDVNNQDFTDNTPSGSVDIFDKDFKFPQVFKTNVSFEKKFAFGLFGLVDFQYAKTLNNLSVQNVNRTREPIGTLTGTGDNRPIFDPNDLDSKYSEITYLTNTSKGHSFSASAQLQKQFAFGLSTSISYNYTRARSVFDGADFINSDNWYRYSNVNGRNFANEADISKFDSGSRIIGSISYQKEFKFGKSLISLFYNGQSGSRFSYVYNDDDGTLNNDDSNFNENRNLIYVPRDANDIILVDKDFDNDGSISPNETAAGQWNALNSYIEGDDHLSKRRGQYAKRNGARTPFENVVDLKIEQSFFIKNKNGKKHELKFSFDIFNFTNLLNKNWGRRYQVSDRRNSSLISFEGFESDSTTPTYTFQTPSNGNGKVWNISDAGVNSSRWQAQFGVRYSFF